jgi:hypothetical protein
MDSPFLISLDDLPDEESLERARDEAQDELAESGSRLARTKWPLLRDAAANCMKTGLSQVDPFALLAGAWCTAAEIRALAAETRAAPGSKEPYPLGKHKLAASVHPVVTLRCGPLIFPGLRFTVTVEGLVDCAILIIANGRLAAVEALSLTPAAVLSYGSKELNRIEGEALPLSDPFVFSDGGLAIP